ncbi:FecR domain-containing protein [Niabella sp. CC-SYL272]|uniref:FecR family protein n=1 Tax=Niabella agricola TaxID=2891571 RepID=UPI001F2FC2C8|nr:FecR domain-containing protein [Niabella agricola]MCF3109147.1 FecR domain-containing protein [Niabella agricola]
MDNDRLLELLGKRSAGELTLKEQIELGQLLKEHPDDQLFSLALEELMTVPTSYAETVPEKAVDEFINQVHQKIARKRKGGRRFQINRWLGAAAAVLILVLTGIGYYRSRDAGNTVPNVVATRKGNKTNIVLPDGTKVWVNADSRLAYAALFGRDTREVELTGEAYFDVVHDSKRPFIVHTKNIDVRVLGTAFNVRSYANEPSTQTTLIRGAVQVSLKHAKDKKIMLAPGEKLVIQNTYPVQSLNGEQAHLPQIELLAVNSNPVDSFVSETEWVNNKLVFDKDHLEQIIPVLERWYNIRIVCRNKPITQTFSGTFENDKLEDVLQSLQLSAGIRYKIEKEVVTFY